jgi:hypothetical protein
MKTPTTTLLSHNTDPLPVITKFSSPVKLQRVIAYVLWFAEYCKSPRSKRFDQPLTVEELSKSHICILRAVQREAFHAEFSKIQKAKSIDKKSNSFCLNVFLDEIELFRVRG